MRIICLSYLLLTTAFLLCAQTAHAWWCLGHMATAQVAKSQMKPNTIAFVENVIQSLKDMGPFPSSPDMVQVACWADDVKSMSMRMMGDWHFIDQPYTQKPGFVVPGQPIQNENVAKVISQFYQGVKGNKANPKGWAMGFAISNLIHFVGDIHQPLHATELFNEEYPTGDAGGNNETIYVGGKKTNLHALWDSLCWSWTNDPARPLTPAGRDTIETFAHRLIRNYSFPAELMNTYDPMVMARESFEFAVNTTYPHIASGDTVTQSYLDACLPVAEARVTLGGIRLGKQLQFLLGNFADEWATAQKKEGVEAISDDFRDAVVNRTVENLSFMKNRFELSLRLRAQELNIMHLKRNNK